MAALSPRFCPGLGPRATVESQKWKINACRDPSGWPRVEKLGHRVELHAERSRIEDCNSHLPRWKSTASFENYVQKGEEPWTGGGGGGWRLGESARREDTVENWGQDENWRTKHDESENSWVKQFPRRVDGIEGIKKIGLVDFRSVFSLGVCV